MDSNLPGWLVFALVTCIYADAYVVQYATFEDLDMLSPWPVSHVGVLAKESNGSLWVIHNNGKGTYSMSWSEYQRRWNAHQVQVGDWKQAWNRSTVEEATRSGSQKYDLLLDNCYDARDAVVGYFSGALTVPPICIPNRTYCSHQLGARSLNTRNIKQDLFQCREDGLGADAVSVCTHGCGTSWNNEAFCQCLSGTTYCGYELSDQGDIRSYEENAVYLCTDKGLNISYIETCVGRCTMGQNSYCAVRCEPNRRYCGYQLHKLDWKEYKNNTLYLCEKDGKNVSIFSACQGGCSSVPNAHCPCTIGSTYCGHELYSMGWTHLTSETDQARLGRCIKTNSVTWVANCESCLSQESGSPHCMCTSGSKYCGHELLEMGWEGYESNTLYLCGKHGKNFSILSACQGGCNSVRNAHCPCKIGSTYCGHELYSMGWTHLTSESDQASFLNPKILYQCTNGTDVLLLQNCTAGCQSGKGANAYCLSLPTPWYWFFMGTIPFLLFVVVLVVFVVVLVGLLMRTIIKHRRLRAFVQQHRIDASQLALTRKLGCGQFGEVWMGNYKGVNGEQRDVALKISKHHLDTPSNLRLASADCFFQESVALDFLRHKNITRALGICSNLKDENNKTTPALILEYMNGGNSIDYILEEREHLIGWDLKQILIDICQAGVHLYKMGVVHRDIGARNVLIGKNPWTGKSIVAKLTDFGLAKDIGNLTGLYKSTNPNRAMFHPRYTAPEGFTSEFSSKSDVWSFGVFMWEVYTLMDSNQRVAPTPYYELSQNDILGKITNGHRLQKPSLASSDTYAVMTDCWRWQTESRPTFDHLLKDLKKSEMDL